MNDIKNFGKPGLKLLGFKPLNYLKDYYNIKSSYFLYPNDYDMKGSSTLFFTLIQEMEKLKYFAIASFIPRSTSTYRLCALLPQV